MGLSIYVSIMIGIILAVVIGVLIALYLFRRNLKKARENIPDEVIKKLEKENKEEKLKNEDRSK